MRFGLLWEERGSPSLSMGGGGCSGEPWMAGRRCGGDNSEGTSLLLQTATVHGEPGCEMKLQHGENWGWSRSNFCWCWGGGDTNHMPSLPLDPPPLCSAIQRTQT